MRAQQPTAQEREQLRRQRSESRMILARCLALGGYEGLFHKEIELTFSLSLSVSFAGFEYVLNPPVAAKVAFGTTMHRDVMPISGPCMTSFMRSFQPEVRPYPSPLDYDCSKPIGFKVNQPTVYSLSLYLTLYKQITNSNLTKLPHLQYPSNAGFSALANKMPRLPVVHEESVPPLGTYEPTPWALRAGYTFDRQVTRPPKWMTPG